MSATWPTPTIHLVGEQYGQRTACGLRVLSGLHVTRQHETITCPDCERVDTDHLTPEDVASAQAHLDKLARRRVWGRAASRALDLLILAALVFALVSALFDGDYTRATFWGLATLWFHSVTTPTTPNQEQP